MEKKRKRWYLKMEKNRWEMNDNSCFPFVWKAYKTEKQGNALKWHCDEFGFAACQWTYAGLSAFKKWSNTDIDLKMFTLKMVSWLPL